MASQRLSTGTVEEREAALAAAVEAVAEITQHLLGHLTTTAPPKNREVEAAKAKARSVARFAS